MTRVLRPGGRATQPSFRVVHSGLGDHTLGGHNKDERPPAAAGGAAGRAVSTGGAGPVTHELDERPAIADRRERVGEGEGDTVAGRMSSAVGHPGAAGPPGVVPGGRQGPLQTRGGRFTAQSSGPLPPTPPPPHRGPGPRVRPRPRPPRTTGRPRPLLQGPLPLAARHRREHQRPAARALPQEDPTGRHQPHADPTGARSTQPTTTQTPRLENP